MVARPGRLEGFEGAPGSGVRSTFAAARTALAVVIGVRLAVSPFATAVGQPEALWLPRGTGLVFPRPPSAAVGVGLQILGVAGSALHLWRRRLAPLVMAWACLLLLAGVRTSLGKVLHNDVLLVLATAPFLLAGRDPDDQEARTGLDAAAATIVLVSYLAAGWWKLLRSGPAWALSDNLRWSLAAGRGVPAGRPLPGGWWPRRWRASACPAASWPWRPGRSPCGCAPGWPRCSLPRRRSCTWAPGSSSALTTSPTWPRRRWSCSAGPGCAG